MNRRIFMLAAVVVAAVAVAGLSAAATTSARGESPKTAKPARQSEAGGPASSPKAQQQSPEELARYWTKERMEGAKPISKTVVGGTRPSGGLPSEPGRTTPAVAQQSQATPKKPQKRKTAAPAEGPAGQASDAGAAADYWTQDKMDKANPMEKSPSGDGGSGSSTGVPGSGGSTTPPTIP